MYAFAAMAVGAYRSSANAAIQGIGDIPESDRFAVEERAAILEFDANLTREHAERLALAAYLQSQSRH